MDAIVYDKVGKEAEKVREALYGIYPQETITDAAIASFDDGADGIPVKALTVGIEPVQDLHGYDNPWPAGGGKNVFPSYAESKTLNGVTFTANADGTVTANGTASANIIYEINKTNEESPSTGVYCHLSEMGIKADTSYVLSGTPSEGAYNYYLQLLVYGSGAEPTDTGSGSTPFSFTASEIAEKWYRLAIRIAPGVTVNNVVFKPMIRLATETDATFVPYENICPISGHTGANVKRTGKNLCDPSKKTVNTVGDVRYYASDGFTLKAGVTYTFSITGVTIAPNGLYIVKQSDFSSLKSAYNATAITYTPSEDVVAAFRSLWNLSPTESMYANIKAQLEEGSAATAYEPYTGNQISVDWEDEAGTVYGGTLDVVRGKLVVDRGKRVLDGTETGGGSGASLYINSGVPTLIIPANNEVNIDCSHFLPVSYDTRLQQSNVIYMSPAYTVFYFNTDIASTFAELQSYFATQYAAGTPVEICYTMSPVEYTLSANELSTLYGTNNVWANTGNTEKLTYRADLGKYIDSHITTAVANALNA